MLDLILHQDKAGQSFCQVTNSDGKTWLIPRSDIRTSLEIYQPNSVRGVLFKSLLPFVAWSGRLCSIVGISTDSFELDEAIRSLVDRLYGSECQVAAFSGTPSPDQKVTIQVSQNKIVRGYLKVANSSKVSRLLYAEAAALGYLKVHGVTHIPMVRYVGRVGTVWCLVQNNIKHKRFYSPVQLTSCHWDFLDQMTAKTLCTAQFEDTDACNTLKELGARVSMLNVEEQLVVAKAMAELDDVWAGKRGQFAFYHGDFTPWNTAINPDGLWAFDFEYAMKLYPPYLDTFHFFIQTKLFIERAGIDEITQGISRLFRMLKNRVETDPVLLFRFYLLTIINLYLGRGDVLGTQEREFLSMRLQLLQKSW